MHSWQPVALRRGNVSGGGRGLALSIVFLLVFSRGLSGPSPGRGVLSPARVSPGLHPTDVSLLGLAAQGQFEELVEQSRAEIDSGHRCCFVFEALVQGAARSNAQSSIEKELRRRLQASPGDGFLLVGYAMALRELAAHRRALNLLATAVRRAPPCHQAVVTYIELSRSLGVLSETYIHLIQLADERPADPFVRFGLAYIPDLRGDTDRALAAYREALLQASPLAVTHRHYTSLLIGSGQFERAAHAARTGARLARIQRQPELLTSLLSALSISLDRLGERQASQEVFRDAVDVARNHELAYLEARLFLEQAIISGSRGEPEPAREHLRSAREIEDRIFSAEDRTIYYERLARVLESLGQQQEAEKALHLSLASAQLAPDPAVDLEARLSMASARIDDNIEEASREFELALSRARQLQDGRRQARALMGLGSAHERMGNYPSSLRFYQEALRWSERAGDRRAEALAKSNIGLVYFRLGLAAVALPYSLHATELARELNDFRLEIGLLQGLAANLAGMGSLAQSETVYRRARQVASRFSLPSLEAAVEAGWARVVLQLGRTDEAKQGFQRALQLAEETESELLRVQAMFGLGQCHQRQGDLHRAARVLQQAVDRVEAFRENISSAGSRINYLETRTQIFKSLAAVLSDLDRLAPDSGYRDRALQAVEQARSRALLDILSVGSYPHAAGGRQRWMRFQPPDPSTFRFQTLRKDELFLEYSLGETDSYLWVLSQNVFRLVKLPSRQEIEKATRSLLESIAVPPRAPHNPFGRHLEPARQLYSMLLGPVDSLISESSHVILSPDGALHYLPFEALVREEPGPAPRYFVDVASISYVPSASVLAWLRARRPPPNDPSNEFLGVAYSGAGLLGGSFGSIPFAREEVLGVAELFPAARRRVYLGNQANELVVKGTDLRHFRILHFAAHAAANELVPSRSAIYLAPPDDPREDGALRMDEVLGLTLNADMVVLSGCQTGRGRQFRAEGILGFTWAFLSAGSSSIVVSLWSVNDRSTSELMQDFYRGLEGGGRRSASLRDAKLSLIRSERKAYRHPYYWAPFVLVGLGL